ncbi:MAG: peptide deformylase, partial [Bacilli bacterium]|nr:peptide deformylase [Bacilli bacterium]
MIVQHEIDHLKGILFYDHIDKQNPYRQINGSVAL